MCSYSTYQCIVYHVYIVQLHVAFYLLLLLLFTIGTIAYYPSLQFYTSSDNYDIAYHTDSYQNPSGKKCNTKLPMSKHAHTLKKRERLSGCAHSLQTRVKHDEHVQRSVPLDSISFGWIIMIMKHVNARDATL
ncbi:hypothetical protein BDA99DRAFT_531869 [Phascolomyces articulosus]|uniref:Uncharacterized protein n=1 Tax=Phascolomyces articulosus TaxID=60185 RepID=A0AAD5KAB9_9FUNG|nr:hypothetical protein BDA99DRAFT_531869 [Phascolomyces articulosus]